MGVVKVLVTSQATLDRLPQQVGEGKLRIFPTARVGQTTLFSLCGLAICLGVLRGADLTSEVKRFKGMPALFVNGKLTRPIICFISESKDLKEFLEAGFTIVDFTPPFDWIGPEEYDFKKTDAEFESYLKQDPHVLLLPRIDPVPGRWWCDKFPNDITLKSDGRRAGMFGEPCYFSFASETYATLSHRALVALITHLESKYGSRIVGYSSGNGVYGEWFSWSAYWEVPSGTPPPENFGMEDYCAPAQSTFKQWLKGKYRGKLEELQRAWGDPKVTFDTASVPSEEIRKHPTYGIFFNPAISSQVPDYFEFFNNMIANVLLEVRVTTEQRAAIHPRFKRNHATPVWVYAPGYINRKLSVENMLALTGIRLAESHSPGELRVEVTSRDHPYTKSLPADFAYGTDVNVDSIKRWFDHRLCLKDPSDSTLHRDLPGFSISPHRLCSHRRRSYDSLATVGSGH